MMRHQRKRSRSKFIQKNSPLKKQRAVNEHLNVHKEPQERAQHWSAIHEGKSVWQDGKVAQMHHGKDSMHYDQPPKHHGKIVYK